MEGNICVRIKSGEYVEALDLSRARRSVLHLTTIEDFQTAAEIPLYLVSGTERTPLATLGAERLSPLTSEECRLDLEIRLLGRRRAEFRVVQNGRLVLTETCGLPAPGTGRRILAAAAILAGVAGLALLSILLIRGCAAGPGSAGASAPRASDSGSARPISRAPSTPPSAAPSASAESAAPASSSAAPETPTASSAPAAASAAAPPPADPLEAAREAFQALGEEALTIYFPADSADLLGDQRDKLGNVAALLSRYPDLGITISGHCATAGTEKGRLALSQDRARTVYRALMAAGWKPKAAPAVEGYGDERPATRAEDRQALNRRVEIRLIP